MKRQYLLRVSFFGWCLFLVSSALMAAYPERSVRVIVPFATGGGTDIMGRVLSERLTNSLGKSFVVENRPGGGVRERAGAWISS
jgi:tripartite-type tricarboxylate transporter receptor subunit TctC